MIVNLSSLLQEAGRLSYAVAGFNIFGYEEAAAVIRAAEEENKPVILMVNHDMAKHWNISLLGPLLHEMGDNSKIPVCVHLDHSKDLDQIQKAVNSGFSSVMFDGSSLPLEENIRLTKKITEAAHKRNISVEAEVGSVRYSDEPDKARHVYTDPEEARRLTAEARPDALAISIGTIHRLTETGASIQYDRLAQIEAVTETPLVIHGSSGIAEDDVRRLLSTRVAKFNIGTALRKAFGDTLRKTLQDDPEVFDKLKLQSEAVESVNRMARRWIRLLNNPLPPQK